MFYIPNIGSYLKMLTDDEVKDFIVINFGKCFKFMKEILYYKLNEEQNLRKVVECFYVFLTIPMKKEICRGDAIKLF